LTSGHASISPGSAADLSQNAADLVLQGDSLLPLLAAIDGSRAAKRRMLENFAFAALYNVVAVPIAFAGWVTPLVAALAMSGSSILVTLNALRTDPPFRAHKRRKDTATPQGQANHAGPAVVAR
jgi:Cu2+-exporting ATPase